MSAVMGPICLIVADQALIGLSLEAYLEEVGFGSCEALPTAAEALAWLAMNSPTVAILDYTKMVPAPPWLVCCGSGASPS